MIIARWSIFVEFFGGSPSQMWQWVAFMKFSYSVYERVTQIYWIIKRIDEWYGHIPTFRLQKQVQFMVLSWLMIRSDILV